jgi:hypothetical protein
MDVFSVFYAWTSWPLKMEPIRSPETSVQNQPTLRNISEDGRIQVKRSDSLRSRKNVIVKTLNNSVY